MYGLTNIFERTYICVFVHQSHVLCSYLHVSLDLHTSFHNSPNGQRTVSPADHDIVAQFGCCVIDCSWNMVDSIDFTNKMHGDHERLCA